MQYSAAALRLKAVEDVLAGPSDLHASLHVRLDEVRALCARARLTGVHRGDLFGVPGTGTPIEQGVITILRFDDGHCVERWSVADTLSVLVQIGAVDPPG
mgnify:CR=1 FL=1